MSSACEAQQGVLADFYYHLFISLFSPGHIWNLSTQPFNIILYKLYNIWDGLTNFQLSTKELERKKLLFRTRFMGKSHYEFTGETSIYLTEFRISTSVWKIPSAERFFSFHLKRKNKITFLRRIKILVKIVYDCKTWIIQIVSIFIIIFYTMSSLDATFIWLKLTWQK